MTDARDGDPKEVSEIIVLRHGETFIKGDNRRFFEDALRRNIKHRLADLGRCTIDVAQGRFYVRCPRSHLHEALQRLQTVFGLTSLSPSRQVPRDVAGISEVALALAEEYLERRAARSFRVTTQRADKTFPLHSPELNKQVGAVLAPALGLPVDLRTPEMVVGIEIGRRYSFVFVERIAGAGGLPVGPSGDVMLLLSGGIDSPVAGHLMQKRGCRLQATYFHAPPHTSERARDKVVQLAGVLAPRQGPLRLNVVRFTELQERLRQQGPPELAVILYRRAMMRIADRLARRGHCKALITGENLGQVASQTLENLTCIEDAASLPVLRPLISFDKTEIIELAERIGSYEISILPHEDTCSLFVPRHPATKAKLERVRSAEAEIDYQGLLDEAVSSAERVTLG